MWILYVDALFLFSLVTTLSYTLYRSRRCSVYERLSSYNLYILGANILTAVSNYYTYQPGEELGFHTLVVWLVAILYLILILIYSYWELHDRSKK